MSDDHVTDLVAFAHVADVQASADFYAVLGLREGNRYVHEGVLDWVWLENGRARLMLARAGEPVRPEAQAVLFYLYAVDLDGLRERLIAAEVGGVGEIGDGTPGPKRAMRVVDPDGYVLMIAEDRGPGTVA